MWVCYTCRVFCHGRPPYQGRRLFAAVQEFYALIYADTTFLKRFHSEVNQDGGASVPAWEHDRRTLSFRTPVDAPLLIKRLVGANSVHVLEEQTQHRMPDGSIVIESCPSPQIPGGAAFSSVATLALRDDPHEGCCLVEVTVTCTATGPYGLTSAIESFMVQAASKGVRQFLQFCVAHIADLQASGSMGSALAAAGAAAAAPAAEGAEAPQEEFYDIPPMPAVPLEPGTASLEVLALYLQYISRTGDQTVAALKSLDARLARLETLAATASPPAAGASAPAGASAWLPSSPWLPSAAPHNTAAVAALCGTVAGCLLTWLWCQHRHR